VSAAISVLVVCTGNICRSPTGEGVLREMVAARGLAERIRVASAGTHDYHVGEPPDPRTVKHAAKRGYERILKQMQPASARAKVGLFLEASGQWKGADVPDPYYGGVAGFDLVLDMVEEAAARWLERFEAELDPATFKLQGSR
jgi:protein-tyrosine phosphatase